MSDKNVSWAVEKNNPEEDVWAVHKDGYASEAEAKAARDILDEVYHRMNWRVTEMS